MLKKSKHIVLNDLQKESLRKIKVLKDGDCFVQADCISLMDIIIFIQINEKIEDIIIESYRFSLKFLRILIELKIKQRVSGIRLIISDSIRQMTPSSFNLINSNFDYKEVNTHAKAIAVKTKNNYYYCTSSGNVMPDGEIEVLFVNKSRELYENTENRFKKLS